MAISLKDLKNKNAQKKKDAQTQEVRAKKKVLRPWEGSDSHDSVVRTHGAKIAVERAQKRLHLLGKEEEATLKTPGERTQEAQKRIEQLEKIITGQVQESEGPLILGEKQAGILSFIKFIFRC